MNRTINIDGIDYHREPDQTMNLGELIKGLERYGPKLGCRFDFGRMRPSCLGSWRGDYAQLTISSSDQEGDITVGEVLDMLKAADGKEFTGWKGGEFKMNLKTRIWADQDGDATQTGIVDVDFSNGAAIICTAHIDN